MRLHLHRSCDIVVRIHAGSKSGYHHVQTPYVILPSCVIGNFLLPTYEVVIMSLLYLSALLLEKIGHFQVYSCIQLRGRSCISG